MDARAMQKGVQQQLSAMDIPMVSEDIMYYVNRAQEQFIDEQYVFLRGKYTDNNTPEIYQNAQKAIENLRTLVKEELIETGKLTPATQFDNAKKADINLIGPKQATTELVIATAPDTDGTVTFTYDGVTSAAISLLGADTIGEAGAKIVAGINGDANNIPLIASYSNNTLYLTASAGGEGENGKPVSYTDTTTNLTFEADPVSMSGGLNSDFYYYVRSQTKIGADSGWVNNKLIEQENIQKFVKTEYNSPVFRDFLVLLEGNNIYIFYDDQAGVDVHEVSFTYLKTPGEIVLGSPQTGQVNESELPRHTHRDIVNIAVELIVRDQEMTGNPRLRKLRKEGE